MLHTGHFGTVRHQLVKGDFLQFERDRYAEFFASEQIMDVVKNDISRIRNIPSCIGNIIKIAFRPGEGQAVSAVKFQDKILITGIRQV